MLFRSRGCSHVMFPSKLYLCLLSAQPLYPSHFLFHLSFPCLSCFLFPLSPCCQLVFIPQKKCRELSYSGIPLAILHAPLPRLPLCCFPDMLPLTANFFYYSVVLVILGDHRVTTVNGMLRLRLLSWFHAIVAAPLGSKLCSRTPVTLSSSRSMTP